MKTYLLASCTAMALLMLTPNTATSATTALTVGQLVDACQRPDKEWIGFCNGYIQAAVDLLSAQTANCVPAGTTRNQVYDAVMPILSARADLKGEEALTATVAVISAAFKC